MEALLGVTGRITVAVKRHHNQKILTEKGFVQHVLPHHSSSPKEVRTELTQGRNQRQELRQRQRP